MKKNILLLMVVCSYCITLYSQVITTRYTPNKTEVICAINDEMSQFNI